MKANARLLQSCLSVARRESRTAQQIPKIMMQPAHNVISVKKNAVSSLRAFAVSNLTRQEDKSSTQDDSLAVTQDSFSEDYPAAEDREIGHSTVGSDKDVGKHTRRTLASFSMHNKVCVVTGAARGIGNMFARTFAESGSNSIAILDLDQNLATEAAKELEEWFVEHGQAKPHEIEAIGVACDVSNEEAVKSAFDKVIDKFGRIDVLVTAAGIVHNYPATEYPSDKMKQLMAINVDGTFFCAREAARRMLDADQPGSIVMIGSMSGSIINIPQPQTPYNASKAAVQHMASSLAVEWAKNKIRVNCISPGYTLTSLTKVILDNNPELRDTWTRLTPMGRLAEPEDLKGAVIYLASDASAYTTGTNLVVDGGVSVSIGLLSLAFLWWGLQASPSVTTDSPVIASEYEMIDGPSGDQELSQDGFDLDELLEQFKSSALPVNSRVDSNIPQNVMEPIGLLSAWKYFTFAASQATNVASAFLSHHVYGPAKPSWGIEMTLFTTFLRNSVDYSHLSSIALLRKLLDLGQVLPTPKDGIVTPISFRVKRRGLTGFLAHADSKEDGQRELTAEWVINRKLWKQMQDDYRGRNAISDSPHVTKEQVVYYLHGGAYYVMSAASHRFLTIQMSKYTDSRLFALNYRLSPETRFPGALLDAVSGYFRLLFDLKIPSENIVVAGDSAGAGLCAALLLYLRDEGYPLPSAAILMSPWVDLTMSCASWDTNAKFDYLPQPADDDHLHPVKCFFRPEEIAQYITHPYASPLFGDYTGLPPMLIQCGDAERLRDEGTLLAHKASLAGVQVEHEIYEDCVHVFQMFGFLEATRKAMRSIRRFVKQMSSKRHLMDNSQIDSVIMAGAHAVRDEDAKLEPESLISQESSASREKRVKNFEPEQDVGSASVLTASRKVLDMATNGKSSKPPSAPSSPSRVLRRLPSNSFIMSPSSRPPSRRHGHSHQSTNSESLRVRPRSNSHPSLRALMDELDRADDIYDSGSEFEGDLSAVPSRNSDSPLPRTRQSINP